jgi:hypothetical protein
MADVLGLECTVVFCFLARFPSEQVLFTLKLLNFFRNVVLKDNVVTTKINDVLHVIILKDRMYGTHVSRV